MAKVWGGGWAHTLEIFGGASAPLPTPLLLVFAITMLHCWKSYASPIKFYNKETLFHSVYASCHDDYKHQHIMLQDIQLRSLEWKYYGVWSLLVGPK